MNLKNQLDIFDEIVSYLAHRVRLSLNYKKVFQFFNRAKLDKVITQTIGSITKLAIYGKSAPSKVKLEKQWEPDDEDNEGLASDMIDWDGLIEAEVAEEDQVVTRGRKRAAEITTRSKSAKRKRT